MPGLCFHNFPHVLLALACLFATSPHLIKLLPENLEKPSLKAILNILKNVPGYCGNYAFSGRHLKVINYGRCLREIGP